MSPDTRDPEVMFWLTVSSYPACCIFHLLAPLPAHTSSHLRANHLTPTSTQTSVATNALKPRLLPSIASTQQLLCLEVGIWKSPFCSFVLTLESLFSFFTESHYFVHQMIFSVLHSALTRRMKCINLPCVNPLPIQDIRWWLAIYYKTWVNDLSYINNIYQYDIFMLIGNLAGWLWSSWWRVLKITSHNLSHFKQHFFCSPHLISSHFKQHSSNLWTTALPGTSTSS